MGNTLRALKDFKTGAVEYIDMSNGKTYSDSEGLHHVRDLVETQFIMGDSKRPVRDASGNMVHVSFLANAAAEHYYTKVAEQVGHPVPYTMTDEAGRDIECIAKPRNAAVTMRGRDGKLFAMDLAISDVHTNSALPNYAAGYHITDGIADVMSPVVMSPKQSDIFYTYNASNDFSRKLPVGGSSGGAWGLINPTLGPTTYQCVNYALGGTLATEIQANADTPLRPMVKLMQMIVDALRLEREIRVANSLQTSGNWNANLVTTIAAGAQWDGGGSSDPVAALHRAIEQSYLPVTGIGWSELVEHDFLRNPSVQKYFTFKDQVNGIPDPMKLSSTLRLPPIHTAMMKYTTGGALNYVWGNHVVLLHQVPGGMPSDQMDVQTHTTFRWMGGDAPDGHVAAGLLVRSFFDPKFGPRGGTTIVATHNDIEVQTSGLVGGLLLNAHQ